VLFCIGELLEERESGKTDEASHQDQIVGQARRLCAAKVVPFCKGEQASVGGHHPKSEELGPLHL